MGGGTMNGNPRIEAIEEEIKNRVNRLIGLEAREELINNVIAEGKERIQAEFDAIEQEEKDQRLAKVMALYERGVFDRAIGELNKDEINELRYVIDLFNSPAHTYKIAEMRVVPREHGDRLLVRYNKKL